MRMIMIGLSAALLVSAITATADGHADD